MEERVKGLLFVCEIALNDNYTERADLISKLVMLVVNFSVRFSLNPNLSKAVRYIENIMTYYMNECQFEYDLYDKIYKYLKYVLKTHEYDESELENIEFLFDYIDQLFVTRCANQADTIMYYNDLIAGGILSNKNYFVYSIENRITDAKKLELLSTIPDIGGTSCE